VVRHEAVTEEVERDTPPAPAKESAAAGMWETASRRFPRFKAWAITPPTEARAVRGRNGRQPGTQPKSIIPSVLNATKID
jgi:hypothetical protein